MGTNEKTEPKKVEELKKVQFDPSDFIKFEGKLEDIQKKKVTVTNKSQSVITFKCKGTSPNHIKIRPAYAFMKPNERTVILIEVSQLNNRPRPPVSERLVVLLDVAPANHPPNPFKMWQGDLVSRNPLRIVIGFKFAAVEQSEKEKVQLSQPQQLVKQPLKKTVRLPSTQKSVKQSTKNKSKSPSAQPVVKLPDIPAEKQAPKLLPVKQTDTQTTSTDLEELMVVSLKQPILKQTDKVVEEQVPNQQVQNLPVVKQADMTQTSAAEQAVKQVKNTSSAGTLTF